MNLLAKLRNSVAKAAFSAVAWSGMQGWSRLLTISREPHAGAWQRHESLSADGLIGQSVVFACLKLISGDISKMRPILKQQQGKIWTQVANPAYSPVLAKPNFYQTPMQFLEVWVLSKLIHGNFFALKMYDNRNVCIGLWPLDPMRVRPIVTTDGSAQVFYQLSPDNMTYGLQEAVTVPAREIIHDRWLTFHHPLVGMSPLLAAAGPATQAVLTERLLARFYRNGAQPSGVLAGPGQIDPDTAKRIEDKWDEDFSGDNSGKVAVLGSGLKFEKMSANVVASDIVDQLKYSGTEVATCFSVPLYKVGLMDQPRAINNIEALQVEYFAQALQVLVEGIERSLTDALGMAGNLRALLDVDNLLRMDGATKATLWGNLIEKGIAAPNEARAAFDLPPVAGGDVPFLQQQNWPISALAGRGVAPSGTTPPEPKSVILRP